MPTNNALNNQCLNDFTVTRTAAAGDVTSTVINLDNTAVASAAHQQISVGGSTSTGDPYTNYLVTGAGTFSVGIDNSDSDKFKITTGASPSAGTELFSMTSAGSITIPGNLNLVRDSSASGVVTYITNTNNGATTANAAVVFETGGTSAGDPFINFLINGTRNWGFGVDNVNSDALKIYTRADSTQVQPSNTGSATLMWNMSTAGERTMPLQPAFLAYQASTATNATGNSVAYTLGSTVDLTEIFDNNSDFDPATGVFTAPVTGKYFFHAVVNCRGMDAANTNFTIELRTSARSYYGAEINIYAAAANGTDCGVSASVLADMSAGDTCIVVANCWNGTQIVDIYGSATLWTYFSGKLEC